MEPNHSETYLRRINNPKNEHKPESEHISHVQKRMKQRFGLEITVEEYYEFLKYARINSVILYHMNSTTTLLEVTYRGKLIWVMYAVKSGDEVPARIKTVLIPNSGYPTPAKFAHLYDHKTFSVAVDQIIMSMVELSNQLDLNDKKSFFLKEEYSHKMKSGALLYKIGNSINSPLLINTAIKCLSERNNITL